MNSEYLLKYSNLKASNLSNGLDGNFLVIKILKKFEEVKQKKYQAQNRIRIAKKKIKKCKNLKFFFVCFLLKLCNFYKKKIVNFTKLSGFFDKNFDFWSF